MHRAGLRHATPPPGGRAGARGHVRPGASLPERVASAVGVAPGGRPPGQSSRVRARRPSIIRPLHRRCSETAGTGVFGRTGRNHGRERGMTVACGVGMVWSKWSVRWPGGRSVGRPGERLVCPQRSREPCERDSPVATAGSDRPFFAKFLQRGFPQGRRPEETPVCKKWVPVTSHPRQSAR